jgi:hypothetical protein
VVGDPLAGAGIIYYAVREAQQAFRHTADEETSA